MENISNLEQEEKLLAQRLQEVREKLNKAKIEKAGNVMDISLPEMTRFFSQFIRPDLPGAFQWKEGLPMWGKIHKYLQNKIPGLDDELAKEEYIQRPDFISRAFYRTSRSQLLKKYAHNPEQQKQVQNIWGIASNYIHAIEELQSYRDSCSAERVVETGRRLLKNSPALKNPEDKKVLYQDTVNLMKYFKGNYNWHIVNDEIESVNKKIQRLNKGSNTPIKSKEQNC